MFGQKSVFGTSNFNTSFGTSSNNVATTNPFGSNASTSSFGSSAFGTPSVFGSSQSNQANTGGIFGSVTGTTPFGTSSFGQSTAGSAFSSNSAFKPINTFSGFGNTPAVTTTSMGIFGSSVTPVATGGGGMFGSTGAFGGAFGAARPTGTTIKFVPVAGQDTMVKSGVQQTISTRNHCITSMTEYEGKSIEELRCEDYFANRKGGGASSSIGMFGTGGSTNQSTGIFGQNSTTGSGGLFGGNQQKPLFGASTVAGPSGFGNTSVPSGGLFGAKPTGFGGIFGQTQASTSSSSVFGSNVSTTKPTFGFGSLPAATTSTGGLFGQNQAKPFGSVAPQTGTGLFGTSSAFGAAANTQPSAFGSSSAFGQQSSIGLFGNQNKPATNLMFGQPAASSSTAIKPFGSASATPAFGSAFGSTASPATGGLFGGTKPASNTFGTPINQAPTFGGFGTGFGSSSTATQPTAFGSFQSTGSGLFGQKPTFGFGTSQIQQPATGGLFGSTNTNVFGATSTGTNFLSTVGQNVGASSLPFAANMTCQQPFTNHIQQQLGSLSSRPYGDDPLFKDKLQDTGKRLEVLKPTSVIAQKALNSSPVVSPHRNIKLKPQSLAASASNNSIIFDGLDDDDLQTLRHPKSELFVPKTSIKKLVIKPKISGTVLKSSCDETTLSDITTNGDSSIAIINGNLNKTTKDSFTTPSPIDDSFAALNTRKNNNDSEELNNITSDDKEETLHPAKIFCKRAGYYTIPTLSELASMVDSSGSCFVEGFTIGRNGYGNIYFPGRLDVAGMNFDEIVFFRHKEVIVYPEDGVKPAVGEGLNRKAQITLDKVWPVDKTERQFIRSPEKLQSINYEEKLKRVSIKIGARFVEYRPESGSWVFKVDHFSKYGLEDSDEDDYFPDIPKKKPVVKKVLEIEDKIKIVNSPMMLMDSTTEREKINKPPSLDELEPPLSEDPDELTIDQNLSPVDEQLLRNKISNGHVHLMKASFFEHDEDEEEPMEIGMLSSSKSHPVILEHRPTNLIKGLGGGENISLETSLRRSEFLCSSVDFSNFSKSHVSAKNVVHTKAAPTYNLQAGYDKYVKISGSDNLQRELKIVPQNYNEPVPNSLLSLLPGGASSKCLADMGLFMGQHFRIGWSKSWLLANPVAGDRLGMVDCVCLVSSAECDVEKCHLEACLKACFTHSIVKLEEYNDQVCPYVRSKEGVEILHSIMDVATNSINKSSSAESVNEKVGARLRELKQVWDLCGALWGTLSESTYHSEKHAISMARKNTLSKWLSKYSSSDTFDNALLKTLSLVSVNKIAEVCDFLNEDGNHYTALLLAQNGGSNSVAGQLIFQQLERWQEVEADQFISPERLRLFSLMSGISVWSSSSNQLINTCSQLNWKRAFAAHLWYLVSSVASITDALLAYEQSFQSEPQKNVYAVAPRPSYQTATNDDPKFDIKYHLLKLYSDRSHSLESTLTNSTHTADPLDFALSWFLSQVLLSLGYRHISTKCLDELHMDFATQLESLDLWHWSAFVLLHMSILPVRKSAIMALLFRNIKLGSASSDKEKFLVESLRIPYVWIAEAQATQAALSNQHNQHAEFLIKAKLWTKAHSVIIQFIAPDAIINNSHDYLYELLTSLSPPQISSCIKGWQNGGLVFYDYISINNEVKALLEHRKMNQIDIGRMAEYIGKLSPLINSLCNRILSLDVSTAKQRLCQSEIGKNLAHLKRAVSALSHERQHYLDDGEIDLTTLPDDYSLHELKQLSRNLTLETLK